MLISKLFQASQKQKRENRRAELYRNLIRHEAKIGGQVFGEIPKNSRREFFCLDEHTWIWHEEWKDAKGVYQTKTTRYDIRPSGILKAQDGQPYQRVTQDEASRLTQAAQLYLQRIKTELYSFV